MYAVLAIIMLISLRLHFREEFWADTLYHSIYSQYPSVTATEREREREQASETERERESDRHEREREREQASERKRV